ncbi:hypothetical protein BH10PAT1_BH10PAT1_0360 [soil metagenome]
MANKEDFGEASQKNARNNGEYWRIAGEAEAERCVFCDLRDKYIIERNDHAVLTANIFPYIDGQLVVIPDRHIIDISEISPDEVMSMHELCVMGTNLLKDKLQIDNVWIILRNGNVAGKTVKHLHWNIMPYIEPLNTWHYQDITVAPIDLASKLRDNSAK